MGRKLKQQMEDADAMPAHLKPLVWEYGDYLVQYCITHFKTEDFNTIKGLLERNQNLAQLQIEESLTGQGIGERVAEHIRKGLKVK